MKSEMNLKDGIIQRLEIEINDLNKLIETKKIDHLS